MARLDQNHEPLENKKQLTDQDIFDQKVNANSTGVPESDFLDIGGGSSSFDIERQNKEAHVAPDLLSQGASAFVLGVREGVTQKVVDAYRANKAARAESEWLTPEQANKEFPGSQWSEHVKRSLARQDHERRQRDMYHREIMSKAGSNGFVENLIPLSTGLIGGAAGDPFSFAASMGVATGLRAAGVQLLKKGKTYGKYLAGMNIDKDGKLLRGSVGEVFSAEVLDQAIGNVLIEGSMPMLNEVTRRDQMETGDIVGNVIAGTIFGTGLSFGLHYLKGTLFRTNKHKGTVFETGDTQADTGLKIDTTPIDKAKKKAVNEDITDLVPDENGGFKPEETPSDEVYMGLDVEAPNGDTQVYTVEQPLGLNTVQLTSSKHAAATASFDPFNTANRRSKVAKIKLKDLNVVNADAPAEADSNIMKVAEELFPDDNLEGLSLRYLLEEAQFKGAEALQKMEDAISADGYNAFSYDDGHPVLELLKRDMDKTEIVDIEEKYRGKNEGVDQYLEEAKNELDEYAKDYNNQLIAHPDRKQFLETEVPQVKEEVNLAEEVNLTRQELDELDEELSMVEEFDDDLPPEDFVDEEADLQGAADRQAEREAAIQKKQQELLDAEKGALVEEVDGVKVERLDTLPPKADEPAPEPVKTRMDEEFEAVQSWAHESGYEEFLGDGEYTPLEYEPSETFYEDSDRFGAVEKPVDTLQQAEEVKELVRSALEMQKVPEADILKTLEKPVEDLIDFLHMLKDSEEGTFGFLEVVSDVLEKHQRAVRDLRKKLKGPDAEQASKEIEKHFDMMNRISEMEDISQLKTNQDSQLKLAALEELKRIDERVDLADETRQALKEFIFCKFRKD